MWPIGGLAGGDIVAVEDGIKYRYTINSDSLIIFSPQTGQSERWRNGGKIKVRESAE